jgi:tetratricopeptide (TPR) repeat protein
MSGDPASRATALLVDEAWDAYREGRYPRALDAAQRAVEAAELTGDLVALVRALRAEGSVLQIQGDHAAALVRFTRILALAQDRSTAGKLDDTRAAWAIADAYASWVDSARVLTTIGVRDLFGVLDAGEQFLTATGHRDWRSDLVLARAFVHRSLDELDTAISLAREALALKLAHRETPSWMLGSYQFNLGDMLCEAGRSAEARPYYQAVLDDPDSGRWDQRIAHTGLASCALAAGDTEAALAQARTATALAEPLGDNALCTSLHVLTRACRASGDLDAAWLSATRNLEAARRIGSQFRRYYATRMAADVALDRSDLDAARPLLAELGELAAAMDTATGLRRCADEATARHLRLGQVARSQSVTQFRLAAQTLGAELLKRFLRWD